MLVSLNSQHDCCNRYSWNCNKFWHKEYSLLSITYRKSHLTTSSNYYWYSIYLYIQSFLYVYNIYFYMESIYISNNSHFLPRLYTWYILNIYTIYFVKFVLFMLKYHIKKINFFLFCQWKLEFYINKNLFFQKPVLSNSNFCYCFCIITLHNVSWNIFHTALYFH